MSNDFDRLFEEVTGKRPFPWQVHLFERFRSGECEAALDLPTGLGKTSVIAIWLIARAFGARLPRRLVYVVNRRTVVDQTTVEVETLRRNLEEKTGLKDLRERFGPLAISTLRGRFADNSEWSADPSRPAVICGTVDMIGSRLLFSGYRIGFKAKPLHAGFLGQDVLLVHDEAHLEPAFQRLVETVEAEQRRCSEFGRFHVMQLSATTRGEENAFGDDKIATGLTPEERNLPKIIPDPPTEPIHHVWRRLAAVKRLRLHRIDTTEKAGEARKPSEIDKDLLDKIVEQALAHQVSGRAVLVFLRKVEDVEKMVKKLPEESTEQLTGTLRGLERDDLIKKPVFQRFLPKSNRDRDVNATDGTVYLVCTSAGEVGVNISADHLVCDLSTFDSMAQRFGRVNRFGDRHDTEIHVAHPVTFGKSDKSGKVIVNELDQQREKTLKLLQCLNGDASPHALDRLDAKARSDAFAPPPTILPATDILFDAWSMTTIRGNMPGRPPVEPYLHGVTEWEPPQTQVAWREEVGVLASEELRERYKPEALLEDYPLKPHELLRDRSDRVFNHLAAIADKHSHALAWLVGDDGIVEVLEMADLADTDKKARISGRTILLPPSVGGLRGGLLDGKSESANDVADKWSDENQQQHRVRAWDTDNRIEEATKGMALIRTIDQHPDADEFDSAQDEEDDDSAERPIHSRKRFWFWYVKPRDAEDVTRASAIPITWDHHTKDVVERTEGIVESLELPTDVKHAVILAARLHDLGKKRELWQRSIGNPTPTNWYAKPGKPPNGPRWRPRRLSEYRHEFGSLMDALDPAEERLAEFEQDEEMRDLILHLIAAHHGRARPHFPVEECYDPALDFDTCAIEQALETPRRFARLQRKYGRWGLAYLESLLRAADWGASAEPSPLKEDES